MKKNAFSYIELIFAMIIIVVLMVATLPLVSRKSKTVSSNVFGEYRCWFVRNEAGANEWFEQSRYNSETLSEIRSLGANSCVFLRPQGASSFRVTLSGGGGGGDVAGTPTYTRAIIPGTELTVSLRDASGAPLRSVRNPFGTGNLGLARMNLTVNGNNITYTPAGMTTGFLVDGFRAYTMRDAIMITRGRGGKAGTLRKFTIPAGAMLFDAAGRIVINSNPNADDLNGNIGLAAPSAWHVDGYRSHVNTNAAGVAAAGDVCTANRCVVDGGAAGNVNQFNSNMETIEAPVGSRIMVVRGLDGEYNSQIAGSGGRGGGTNCETFTEACVFGTSPQEIGAGGGGAGALCSVSTTDHPTDYNFQEYHVIKFYREVGTDTVFLSDRYDLYIQGVLPQNPRVACRNGRGGAGSGGGIRIEW